ncbi:shikimate kinase [Lachnotalea glycerini]|uniref:Shikimate kinase n=1 Tax=Lachnotalea glycerini TaxID=1763509 RepID=A0A371JI60_9FIRM|nr:shikimate kinase [Lachnotalea glycerini]RDY32377.1 dephospho-CoA kinase [Lachnotalea glycerini]
MRTLEEIREQISQCDDQIVKSLEKRMDYIQEIIQYKKENGLPILQPEQEKKQREALKAKLQNHKFEEEILDTFRYIVKNSRKIQAKSLFSYNIMLIGFMGAGKSTVSSYLSHLLEMEEVDTDKLIVEKEGMSIPQIFEEFGESYFRNCESNTLIELQKRKQLIVSCGGGIVLREENVDHMKKRGRIVLLTATPETTLERVKDSTERPILNNNMNTTFIAELMDKRREKYLAAADIIVETDHKTIAQISEEVVAKLTALE